MAEVVKSMVVEPVVLEGRVVRLEPLTPAHAAPLMEVADPGLFLYIPTPPRWDAEGFSSYIERLISTPDMRAFATVLRETGQPIGVTTYMDIRPSNWGLEIGSTWIARPWQGTQVNPECKYLLLCHAFEQLHAVRVQLKTDGRNLHSQAAISKLGAKREGTLRKHVVMYDGYIRDTVMFSIIQEEWPGVKARLEARLGYGSKA